MLEKSSPQRQLQARAESYLLLLLRPDTAFPLSAVGSMLPEDWWCWTVGPPRDRIGYHYIIELVCTPRIVDDEIHPLVAGRINVAEDPGDFHPD